jgi:hypothetical protein
MWPIQLAFLLFIVRWMLLSSLTLCNTLSVIAFVVVLKKCRLTSRTMPFYSLQLSQFLQETYIINSNINLLCTIKCHSNLILLHFLTADSKAKCKCITWKHPFILPTAKLDIFTNFSRHLMHANVFLGVKIFWVFWIRLKFSDNIYFLINTLFKTIRI